MTNEQDLEMVKEGLAEGENWFKADRGYDEEKNAEARKWWHERSAALSRIEAELQEAWKAAEDAGLRADRNSDYVAKLQIECDALKAALESITDRNQELADENDALRAALDQHHEVVPDCALPARQALKELEEK
jgi:hypothetical protein